MLTIAILDAFSLSGFQAALIQKKEKTEEYLNTAWAVKIIRGFVLLSPKLPKKIEAIAMDIWDPNLTSIREYVPEADEKIVFDRYHLMAHMVKVLDKVRK